MFRRQRPSFQLTVFLGAACVLAGCGDNLREHDASEAETVVALDLNLLTGPAAGASRSMGECSTYPSRC